MNVLIVDDFQTQRIYTKGAFESLDVQIYEAENGKNGFELAQKILFDLILTDKEMPVMDGFEMTAKIRKDTKNKSTPIVMISSRVDAKKNARKNGISGWITKPFDRDDITKIIQKYCLEMLDTKYKVLLIDDVNMQTTIWAQMIKMPKFSFDEAHSARKALKMMREKDYDAVITDYLMPEVDGLRFTKKIKSMPEFKHIPILMISTEKEIENQAPELGVSHFFSKPFNPIEVKNCLKQIVGK
jgi:two-component system chemotaxis response regulator CheY